MALPENSAIGDYGMPVSDYLVEVTDATTDQPADGASQQAADTAAMTRTCVRAWCTFTGHATTPVLVSHDAVWGTSVAPVVAHTGAGTYTVTWPATVTDSLGETYSVNIRCPLKPDVGGSTLAFAQCTATSANVVTVYTFNAAGAANDLAATAIRVAVI